MADGDTIMEDDPPGNKWGVIDRLVDVKTLFTVFSILAHFPDSRTPCRRQIIMDFVQHRLGRTLGHCTAVGGHSGEAILRHPCQTSIACM